MPPLRSGREGFCLSYTAIALGLAALALSFSALIAWAMKDSTVVVHIPRAIGFRRDFAANCVPDNGFTCIYASDPNPSYLPFKTPPLTDGVNDYQYFSPYGSALDISDPYSAYVPAGKYDIELFFSVFGETTGTVGIVITEGPGAAFQTPAIVGSVVGTFSVPFLGGINATISSVSASVNFPTPRTLRVAYVTTVDVQFPPSAAWSVNQIY